MAHALRDLVTALGALAVTVGCGGRASSRADGPIAPTSTDAGTAISVTPDAATTAPTAPDAASGAGGDGTTVTAAEPAQPPAAAAGLMLRTCGAMVNLPQVLGVDADGNVVLLAQGYDASWNASFSVHLFSRAAGRVIRSISDAGGLLTADRQHVVTPSTLLDLRTGKLIQSPPQVPQSPPGDILAAGPSGDFLIVGETMSLAATRVVSRRVADNSERELVPATVGRAYAAAVADDGLRFFLLVVKAPFGDSPVTIEIRHVSDGNLEREIPISGGAVVPSGGIPGLLPRLTTSGDYALANLGTIGYRAFRISDGALVWSPDPSVNQAQLSPQQGVVAFRASSGDPWQRLDMTTGRITGTFAPSQEPTRIRDFVPPNAWPLLAFTPSGDEVVFSDGGSLRVGRADTSTTPLPFKSGGWCGRSVFLSASEVVSVEEVDGPAPFTEVVRKHALPSGEILAEMSSGERQSEWDGDLAVSPDGSTIAVAFPDRVHLLRSADLSEVSVIPRAAGRVAWSADGAALATTPDLHYRDPGRPASDPPAALDVWTLDGRLQRTFALPFVPFFAAFTADGLGIVATGQAGVSHIGGPTSAQTSSVQMTGAAQSVRIDRTTGATLALGSTPVAVDAAHHFVTDLHAIARLHDDKPIAFLDPPPQFIAKDPLLSTSLAAFSPVAVFSPDAALVAGVAVPDNGAPALVLYATASGKTVQSLPLFSSALRTLAFSPDGRQLGLQWRGGAPDLGLVCLTP